MKDGPLQQCIGYVCGTVIIVTMLVLDGEVALIAATSAVAAMFGVQKYANLKKKE